MCEEVIGEDCFRGSSKYFGGGLYTWYPVKILLVGLIESWDTVVKRHSDQVE